MPYIDIRDIYSSTNNGLDIILSLYPDAAESVHKPNQKFKTRDEKTASAKLLTATDGAYLVIDFGGDQQSRNAIQCYMHENRVEWEEAIQQIAAQFNIQGSDPSKTSIKAVYSERAAKSEEQDGTWFYETRDSFNDIEIETIVSSKILKSLSWKSEDKKKAEFAKERIVTAFKFYHCHPMISYSIVKNRKVMTYTATDQYPMFLIDEGFGEKEKERFQKIYQPKHHEKGLRFMYIPGKKPKSFIHGLLQLNKEYQKKIEAIESEKEEKKKNKDKEADDKKTNKDDYKLDEVILCTGFSDAINVHLCSYLVIWLNSETEFLGQFDYDRISNKVKRFYVLGDIDETGMAQRHKLCMAYLDIYDIELPEELGKYRDQRGNRCKDVRDYFNHFTRRDFENLVNYSAMPYRFWDKKPSYGKNGGEFSWDYRFKNEYAYNFLQKNGFYRLPVGDQKTEFEYIQIEGNTVHITDPVEIKGFIKNFLRSRHMDVDLRDEMHRTAQLNDSSLQSLDPIKIDFLDNDKNTQFLFFQNKTLEVTAQGVIDHKPGAVRRFVWEDEVYKHKWEAPKAAPFTITKSDLGDYDITINEPNCLFLNYLIQTSRVHWRVELEDRLSKSNMTPTQRDQYLVDNKYNIAGPLLTPEERDEQKKHLINKIFAIGYLMHRYKHRSKGWFIFAMDAKLNDDGQSHGGSGKSILFDLAMTLLIPKHFMINGRNPKINEDVFKYDGVSEHHDYVFVDDAYQYIKLDIFYPDITGDMKVNPKGKTGFTIPFEKSPKLSFSSNYTPRDLGPSTERRMIYTVFSDYYHYMGETTDYNESRDPSGEFGKQMFVDFNHTEWNMFYNTSIECLKFYLGTNEKITPSMSNVNARNLTAQMGDVFKGWADTYFSEIGGMLDVFFPREEAYEDYKFKCNPLKATPQNFKTKLAAWCKLEGFIFNPKKYQGPKKNIIQKHARRYHDKRSNTWTPMADADKVATEMFYIQTVNDVPEEFSGPELSADELVRKRQAEIAARVNQEEIPFEEPKNGIEPNLGDEEDYPI